jgi:hypothetical protein
MSPKEKDCMKKEDFYPARVMGKLHSKEEKDKLPDNDAQKNDEAQKTSVSGAAPLAGTPTYQTASSGRTENSPLMAIMSRFTGQGDAGESPFAMIMNGALDSLRGRAIHDVAHSGNQGGHSDLRVSRPSDHWVLLARPLLRQ